MKKHTEVTMSNKHTPIEQWIEENQDRICVEMKDVMPFVLPEKVEPYVIEAIEYGFEELLTYLGLQDIDDPKNHIRHLEFRANEGLQTSKELEDFKENAERLSLKYSFKIESLEAENERLKAALTNIYEHNTKSVTVLRKIAFDAIDKESQDQALKGE